MTKYVFTTHMKRHERADLCMKLFKEMFANRRIADQLTALQKRFAALQKGINKFKPRKEPLYTIEIIEYKGTVCYLIISQSGGMAFIYNSSPIDGAFAEFVSIVDGPSTKTVVYTQHALDRYNERVHKGKYTNHRDIIKRLMVNNPTMANGINNDRTNKTVGRLEEGFMCGSADIEHKMTIYNTFFDKQEFKDNKDQKMARGMYEAMIKFNPKQLAMFNLLNRQLKEGIISNEDFERLSAEHGVKIDIDGIHWD